MKTWILYKDNINTIKSDDYEINRFLELKNYDIDLDIISPDEFDIVVNRDDRKSIIIRNHTVHLPEVFIPRMGSGTTYFALSVIRQMERIGVPTINSSHSIEMVKDKLYSHQVLAEHHMPIPKTMLAKFPIDIEQIEKHFGFPIIVKTLSGSYGNGVYLCETKRNFIDLMQMLKAVNHNTNLILQEFISESRGKDIRVLVIGGKAKVAMERQGADDNFRANYSQGGSVKQIDLTKEMIDLAEKSSKILGLSISGIDLLYGNDGLKICEANSAPGFSGIEKCCNIDVIKEVSKLIKKTVKKKKYS